MNLRPYQLKALDLARQARRQGNRRILIVSPTGSGKTVLACSMIQTCLSLGGQVLVIGHRKEIVDQFWSHLYRNGIVAGILRGGERTDPSAPVQVGTIQTLGRRDLPQADLVFVDEAHRCPGESYQRLLAQYPKATIFGLTATPWRLDGQGLGEHFDTLIQVASYSELIEQGAIAEPVVYSAQVEPDLTGIRKVAGDYNESQLEKACSSPHVIGDVVETYKRLARCRKAVCFAVGVEHSRSLVEAFRDDGVQAAHLDGSTPESERERILVDLETGTLDVVSNVGVLCEGWDQPSVKCCIMARPTLSLTLWMQCAGRILRPSGGVRPIILDHSGNAYRHGLPHEDRTWSLATSEKTKSETLRYRICKSCFAYVDGFPCPLCGGVEEKAPRVLREKKGELTEVKDPKRAFYDAQLERARRRAFKPGFAAAKFKEKFGAWPPWDWSQKAKAQFASDTDWQTRLASREQESNFWKEIQGRLAAERNNTQDNEVADGEHD